MTQSATQSATQSITKSQRIALSLGILAIGVTLTYSPLFNPRQTLLIISGTELQEPLDALVPRFASQYPDITVELDFQGSQDIVNNYIDDQNETDPAILIPANGVILEELEQRWKAQHSTPAFHQDPSPIVSTVLVGVAWPERGSVLFPTGLFDWERLESAMDAGLWDAIRGEVRWGSFDFLMTDPTRSNSGQLTMSLWATETLGLNQVPTPAQLNTPAIQSLFNLVKRSVYQPPRSTDTLLREFIARGSNDADVATVYESIALFRWSQSSANQANPYQIYYLNPTFETVSMAAIVTRNIDSGEKQAAQTFLDFLLAPDQQAVFVQYGFRPQNGSVDLTTIPDSPWAEGIPGAQVQLPGDRIPLPSEAVLGDIKRLWERAN